MLANGKSEQPLVSVTLPVYNGMGQVERALDSLLAQTYTNTEIVVCDNASTDGTAEYIAARAEEDKRIKLHRNDKNIGMIPNFARTLDLATGDYFMWTSADDFWKPTFIEKLLAVLEGDKSKGLVFCSHELHRQDDGSMTVRGFNSGDNPNHWNWSKAFLKSCEKRNNLDCVVYGLGRTSLMKSLSSCIHNSPMWDRLFVPTVFAATNVAYVDDPLYVRTQQALSLKKRYKKDPVTQLKSPIWRLKHVSSFACSLTFTFGIPIWRKWIVPFALWKYGSEHWQSWRKSAAKGK